MPYVIIGLFENNERFREDVTADRFESIVDVSRGFRGSALRTPKAFAS